MLACTHAAVGALLGRMTSSRGKAVLGGLASHAMIDGIGHDDSAIGVAGQCCLLFAALTAVVVRCGMASPAMAGSLAGVAPDVEIILQRYGGRPDRRLYFPSHWQTRRRRGTHPWRYPGPGLNIASELACAAIALTLAVAPPVRRPRRGTTAHTSELGPPVRPSATNRPASAGPAGHTPRVAS